MDGGESIENDTASRLKPPQRRGHEAPIKEKPAEDKVKCARRLKFRTENVRNLPINPICTAFIEVPGRQFFSQLDGVRQDVDGLNVPALSGQIHGVPAAATTQVGRASRFEIEKALLEPSVGLPQTPHARVVTKTPTRSYLRNTPIAPKLLDGPA